MIGIIRFSYAVVIAAALAKITFAAEMPVKTVGLAVKTSSISVKEDSDPPETLADGSGWQYEFSDPKQVINILDLQASFTTADGKATPAPYAARIIAPYYWQFEDRTMILPAADGSTTLQAFVNFVSRSHTPNTTAQYMLINQQATIAWQVVLRRLNGKNDNANANDIKVAYWVAATANWLVPTSFVEPSEAALAAISLLKTARDDQPDLLAQQKISPAEIGKISIGLLNARSIMANKIVQELEKDLSIKRPDTCQRIHAFLAFFDRQSDQQLAEFDLEFANTLKTRGLALLCDTRALSALDVVLDKETREKFEIATQLTEAAIYSSMKEDRFGAVIPQIQKIVADAKAVLAKRQVASAPELSGM